MSTSTKTVKTTTSGVAVHTITFRGLAGAIFVCLTAAAILFAVGFATNNWAVVEGDSKDVDPTHRGLWQACSCPVATQTVEKEADEQPESDESQSETTIAAAKSTNKPTRARRAAPALAPYDEDWFLATQATITIGLIGIVICLILSGLYLTVHTISKNSTILALVIFCFLTVIFMVVGYAIFGSYMGTDVNWSFALCVLSSVFCLIAGILAIVQMKQSGVRI